MPRDDRTYITVDDGMPDHPKIEALSDAAFRALVSLWCWCSRNRTDGRVPQATWMKRTTARVRKELMAAPDGYQPLVEAGDGGVVVHDYLQHQRSRAEIEELKAKRALAGAKGGRARAARQASATASAAANGKQRRGRTQPDTETETEIPEPDGSGPPSSAAAVTEPLAGMPEPPPVLDVVPSALGDPQGAAREVTSQVLVAEWIDHCGSRPPGRVVGQVARELGAMLAEGIPVDDVRAGLQAWHSRGLHPSALASMVHEQRTAHQRTGTPRRSTTDDRVAAALALAERFDAHTDPADPPAQFAIGGGA